MQHHATWGYVLANRGLLACVPQMTDGGDMKEDLSLPAWPEELGAQLEAAITTAEDEGKTVVVSVISSMEKEAVTSFKVVEV